MKFDVELAFFETLEIAKILNHWGKNDEINLAILILMSIKLWEQQKGISAHSHTHTHTTNHRNPSLRWRKLCKEMECAVQGS